LGFTDFLYRRVKTNLKIVKSQKSAIKMNIAITKQKPVQPAVLLTTAEILKKVKELEIKSKKITQHLFTGEYHSAFKGRGMSFREVRESTGM